MKYNAAELINTAIMTHIPTVLVEGKDDISIYNCIVDKLLDKEINIYAINQVEGYSTGANHVIKCIHDLTTAGKFTERAGNDKRLLGIVDRDVRPYRALLAHEIDYTSLLGKGLFMLKYYSIETYFATQNNLKEVIGTYTSQPRRVISQEAINFVESNHQSSLNELYYFSLEALKNACTTGYVPDVSYKATEIDSNKKRQRLMTQLAPKTALLDEFAEEKGIAFSDTDIKLICKGKWYLYSYVYKGAHNISLLSTQCKASKIPSCALSTIDNHKECLYALSQKKINTQTLYEQVLSMPDKEELEDILTAFQNLA